MNHDLRKVTYNIISEFEKNDSQLKLIRDRIINKADFSSKDKSRITVCTNEIVKWRKKIDYYISINLKKSISKLDKRVLNILRIGYYEILFDAKIPIYASVDYWVQFTKIRFGRIKAGFCNAILRKARKVKINSNKNVSYNLYAFTATAESGLQIIEQVLPFFQPDYTVTINVIPNMNIKRDVPIVLNSVNYEDTYSGDFTTRRAVIYTLNFTAKTYLFGPSTSQKVIKTVQSDQYSDTDTVNKARESRIIVVPSPTTADADDDFGFTTTIDFFEDSKKYNVTKDTDE